MTAAHLLAPLLSFERQGDAFRAYMAKVVDIENDQRLSPELKHSAIAALDHDPEWIRHISYWWGEDAWRVEQFQYDWQKDIAIGRIIGFDSAAIDTYPRFRDPNLELTPGTSLCRLGFPFHDVKTTCNMQTGVFQLEAGSTPVPFFPMDGIMTRTSVDIDPTTSQQAHFIEMSTPGLRGQSGGPIFDTEGNLCGLQSKTRHLPLGFDITGTHGGQPFVDRQYLHVGLGLHAFEIMAYLDKFGIKYETA